MSMYYVIYKDVTKVWATLSPGYCRGVIEAVSSDAARRHFEDMGCSVAQVTELPQPVELVTMKRLVFGSTKRYTPGFSCAFAQWRADSHCRYLHGYALEFEFTFEADDLDARNWVVDFGGLKPLKGWLEQMFDHTTLVATDNPDLDWYRQMHAQQQIQLREVVATGCEATAYMVYQYTEQWLKDAGFGPRCRVVKVEVREHDGNSAYVRVAD